MIAWVGSLLLSAALFVCDAPERAAVFSHRVDPAAPPPAFVAVNRTLRAAKAIRADFAEEKHIRGLQRRPRSSGALVIDPGIGLYRIMREPFVQEVIVTPTAIAQRDAKGRVERLDVAEQPLAKGFVDAFLLVFSGHDKALAADFELYFTGTEEAWELGFVPRRKPLSRFIASLHVTGRGGSLSSLEVVEQNGDRTRTTFTDVVTDRELGPEERERTFGWQK